MLIRRPIAAAAVAMLASAAGARPAVAQLPGISLGASIGANVPRGRFDASTKTGLVANGMATLRLSHALGIRAEALWSRSDLDSPLIRQIGSKVLPPGGYRDVSGNVNLIGGLADVVLSTGSSFVRPYVIAGVGVYHRRVAQDLAGTIDEFRHLSLHDDDVGYNGGVGLRLSLLKLSAFVEARYHSVGTSPDRTNFVPVTVGVMF